MSVVRLLHALCLHVRSERHDIDVRKGEKTKAVPLGSGKDRGVNIRSPHNPASCLPIAGSGVGLFQSTPLPQALYLLLLVMVDLDIRLAGC
ncbi:hypothetical protein WJX77_007607 [Trebouxia sp. C0004]